MNLLMQCLLYDTHAHLVNSQLANRISEVCEHAQANGVGLINCIATDLETSHESIALAEKLPGVFATVGWHPNDCLAATTDQWNEIKKLALHSKVVALGETGLDLYWKDCPIELQRQWFARHWELSREIEKPVVIHMRDCEAEMLKALRSQAASQPLHGVMHSFTGCWETAAACLEMGLYISFAGMLTFKNSEPLRQVARQVPLDRLLVETDSPYLTPDPHRGKKPNQPGWVKYTAECLAELRGMTSDDLAHATTANGCRLFGVEPSGIIHSV